MWGRLGPRFALEAAFLILLAVGLGLADQDWPVVVAVMAGGWALVSLIELIASRRPPWPVGERPAVVEGPPALPHEPAAEEGAAPAPEPVVEEAAVPPPELEPEPEPVAEEVAPPGAEEPVLPEAPVEPEPAAAVGEETQEVPLPEERPQRRRWFRRRTEERAEIAEPPKHVRKLGPEQPAEAPAGAESGEERS